MEINYIKGNVLDFEFTKPTLVCQVNNDRGGYGSGYAAATISKWPFVQKCYRHWFRQGFTPTCINLNTVHSKEISPWNLGEIQAVQVIENPLVYSVQMLAQSTPGGTNFNIGDKEVYLRPIRLDSLRHCLYNVASLAKKLNAEVAGPMFGGGLAGASFENEIVPLIEECLLAFDIPVTIFKLE